MSFDPSRPIRIWSIRFEVEHTEAFNIRARIGRSGFKLKIWVTLSEFVERVVLTSNSPEAKRDGVVLKWRDGTDAWKYFVLSVMATTALLKSGLQLRVYPKKLERSVDASSNSCCNCKWLLLIWSAIFYYGILMYNLQLPIPIPCIALSNIGNNIMY